MSSYLVMNVLGNLYLKKEIFCMTGALVYVRDKDSGTVYLGSDNLPRISYWPSKHDRASMMKVLAS